MRRLLTVATSVLLVGAAAASPPVEPANSFLSCHPFAAQADGRQKCVVHVRLRDRSGTPLAGRPVALASSRGPVDRIEPATATSDAAGFAEFAITSETAGTEILSASVEGVPVTIEVVDNGLVALYTFDGDAPEARVRDLSGKNNHGTVHGNPAFVAGHRSDALSLNGTDQYVEVPHSDSLKGHLGHHVECWMRTAASPPAPPTESEKTQETKTEPMPGKARTAEPVVVLIQKSHQHGGDYNLSLHGQKIAYHYRCSQREPKQLEEALSDYPVITPDRWMQLAGFWEGSNVDERVRFRGYVRAYASEEVEFDPRAKAQQVEGIWNGRSEPQPLSIGRNGNGSQYFHGLIDDVRAYNRALYDEEMRRNHAGVATVTFGLVPPEKWTADAQPLPECVVLSWDNRDRNVTTYHIYRATTPEVEPVPENLLKIVPHNRDHFRDYEVDHGTKYYYTIVAHSFENASLPAPVISATPRPAPHNPRWYRGDGHLHTYTHDIDVEDFDPENTLETARKAGWDFALVTDHNSLGAYFRSEDQGTPEFIVMGNGQEISDGGEHRTGAFLGHFVPTPDTAVVDQNRLVLSMGGEVGPNHNAYRNSAPNITLFEVVNDRKWYPLDAWDNEYLKQGIHVTAKGGSDAHGRFSVKRGYRWCVWADRLSYRALRQAIHAGRTFAVDGDGLECLLKVNGAMIGDTLTVAAGTPLTVELSAEGAGPVSEVKLIRDGETIETWSSGEKRWSHRYDAGSFAGTPGYFRMEVRSEEPKRRAVTSAIFVRPLEPASSK